MKKVLIVLTVIALGSCDSGNIRHDHHHDHHDHDHDFVEVNQDQKDLAGIVTGRAEVRNLSFYLGCSGMVDVPPESRADISAPLGGFVRRAPHYEGALVKKGEVLVSLVHPDYVRLQQEYLDAESQLKFLEADKLRQDKLVEGEAASKKRFQEIEMNYTSMKARRDGLAAQLRVAGLSPQTVKQEGIQELVHLRAPFSGIISMEAVNLGKQVGPEEVLYQMYDPDHMHIELQVFPRDIDKLAKGQKIRYKIQGSKDWKTGHIVLLGGGVHPELRTIRVHAHPDEDDRSLRPGTFIQAEIEVDAKEVLSLPETAFHVEEDKYFVFIEREGGFKRIPVRVGRKSGGFVELLQPLDEVVVIEGAYYLVEVDEAEHDH